jgi:predicted O-methyltransferase YrrM
VFRKYARIPWLAFPAIDYLGKLVPGRRVFEFGSGMSTLWFAERCDKVVSVENNPDWYQRMTEQTKGLRNVQLLFASSKESYVQAIAEAGGEFGLILIDGLYRDECIDLARDHLSPGGVVVVDNTDTISGLADQIKRVFGDSDIKTFRGWVPGNLHPNETTIIEKIPVINEAKVRAT